MMQPFAGVVVSHKRILPDSFAVQLVLEAMCACSTSGAALLEA